MPGRSQQDPVGGLRLTIHALQLLSGHDAVDLKLEAVVLAGAPTVVAFRDNPLDKLADFLAGVGKEFAILLQR